MVRLVATLSFSLLRALSVSAEPNPVPDAAGTMI
jgi:hypothetical protein